MRLLNDATPQLSSKNSPISTPIKCLLPIPRNNYTECFNGLLNPKNQKLSKYDHSILSMGDQIIDLPVHSKIVPLLTRSAGSYHNGREPFIFSLTFNSATPSFL
jgi:hypothetical protein